MPEDLVLVGRIARTHGVRGDVLVNPETDFPEERFVEGRVLQMEIAGRTEPITIESCRRVELPVIKVSFVGVLVDGRPRGDLGRHP